MPPRPTNIRANGWVMRNILIFGNSVVPHDAIRSLMKIYKWNWQSELENILTDTLQKVEDTTDIVVLKPGSGMKGLWIAWRKTGKKGE